MPRGGISKTKKNPRKKKAKGRTKTPASLAGNELLFEDIPDRVIESIIRCMSSKPNAPGWQAYVPDASVEALGDAGGALSRLSKKAFSLRFDELPDPAVNNILRFMSYQPQNGIRLVPVHTVLSLVKTRGSLSRVARDAFSSVIYTRKSMNVPDDVYSIDVSDAYSADLMEEVANELGRSLRTLCMRAPISGPFTARVLKPCTAIRSLSFKPFS